MSEREEDGNHGHLYEEADEEISSTTTTTSQTESQNENEDDSPGEHNSSSSPRIRGRREKEISSSNNLHPKHLHQHLKSDSPPHNTSPPQHTSGQQTNNNNKMDNSNDNHNNENNKPLSLPITNSGGESKLSPQENIDESQVKERISSNNSNSSSSRNNNKGISGQNGDSSTKNNSSSGSTNKEERVTTSTTPTISAIDKPLHNKDIKNVKSSSSNNTSENNNLNKSDRQNSVSPTENVPKLSSASLVVGKQKDVLTPNKINNRLSVTVAGLPFESGVNTECIQLLRQLWNVHEEAVQFLERIRRALCHFRQELRSQENEFESSFQEKRLSTGFASSISSSSNNSNAVKGKKFGVNVDVPSLISYGINPTNPNDDTIESRIPLHIFIDGLKCISESFSDIDKQYLTLSVFQSQCKLALFAKVKHAKQQVTHDRLSIMHGVQQLISVTLHLLSTPYFWSHTDEERTAQFVQNVFQLTEVYNWCLESSWSMSTEAAIATTSPPSLTNVTSEIESAGVQQQQKEATESSSKTSSLSSKLRILIQINAASQNDSPLLRLSLKPLTGTRLLQIIAQKRSTFAAHSFSRITLQSFYANSAGVLSMDKFEPCFSDEDSRLSPLGKGFSQCPSLLGRAAVKKTENGDQRLSRSARTKMYSYFHEVLWTLAGEHSEDLLLWGPHSNLIPLVLQPLDTFIALRNALMLGQHFQESNLSPMLSAFDSVGAALHSFTLLANWDEKMREAFEETYKVKRPEHVTLLRKPEPYQWATEIGSKFGQIVTSCISLIDGGGNSSNLSNTMRSTAMRLSSNGEEPLGDEAQTLFRLEATLVYFKAWVVKRAKVWLNSWAIPQFLACSQREPALLVKLIKSRETVLITRDILLNNPDISIRLSAKHRQECADDLRTALHQLQAMPEELLQAVGPVCRTLSLATLQSNMPASNHWRGVGRGSGLDPDKPSSYVHIFIERVIEPVITASVELVPGTVQEAMGKQVIHAACDAWLQYILQKKIRFSEWGAVQLLRDFTAFREWIRTETQLEKEARKAILQLEVLKRCEGVAYLLLRNPGDILGVGKPTRKNRRIAPSSGSVGSSPSMSDSAAEDDIPPEMYVPNQQMWLELRLRRSVFTSPCCQ